MKSIHLERNHRPQALHGEAASTYCRSLTERQRLLLGGALLFLLAWTAGCEKAPTESPQKKATEQAATTARAEPELAPEQVAAPAPPPVAAAQPDLAPEEVKVDCGGSDWERCLQQAMELEKKGELAERFALLVQVCEGEPKSGGALRSTAACAAAGMVLMEGSAGIAKDLEKAASYFERGCNDGGLEECAALGVLWSVGDLGQVDWEKAASFFEKACNGGRAESCADVALAQQRVALGTPDTWAGKCDAGEAAICLELGRAQVDGREGFAVSPEEAAKALQKGCDGDNGAACDVLGLLYIEKKIDGGFKKAEKAFRRGCELNDGAACHHASQAEVPGKKRHVELLEKGCELGSGEACFEMGVLYSGGFIKDGDPEQAKVWHAKACALGHRAGCGLSQ